MKRGFAVIWLCIAVWLMANGQAWAHATLLSSVPADGAMTAVSPDQITLTFNEPVQPTAMGVVTPDGRVIPLTPKAHDQTVDLTLPALGIGTHVLSWRVTSADGHPVSGALLFSIGRSSEIGKADLSAPLSLLIATLIARFALYVGLFFGVGGMLFRSWISENTTAAIPLIRAALWIGLIAVIPSLGLQGLDLLGESLSRIGDPRVWRAASETTLAATLALATAAILIALFTLGAGKKWGPKRRYADGVALVLAATALAASGHASTAPPQWLMRPTVWLHALGIALWAGSLWPLYAALQDRAPAKYIVTRYSSAVVIPFLLLIASGVMLAIVQIASLDGLTTSYGKILIAKLLLVTALLAVVAVNRFVLTPGIALKRRGAAQRLGRMIVVEIALVTAILALVTLWRFTPPPRVLANAEPVFVHIHHVRGMADVTLSPGRAGPLSATIKLMREDFTTLPAQTVELALSNPGAGIESLTRTASLGPDGIWRAENLDLPVPGRWEVEIVVLISDFDRIRLDGPILIPR